MKRLSLRIDYVRTCPLLYEELDSSLSGFERLRTNSSDTPNTVLRVQVHQYFNEISGVDVDLTMKLNFGSLLKFKFTATGTLLYSPCLYHEVIFSCPLLVKHFH